MVDTRQDKLRVFTHILEVILADGKDGPISNALTNAYIRSIPDLMALEEADINTLSYETTDSSGQPSQIPLEVGRRGMIRAFKAYVRHLDSDTDFEKIQVADFDTYRIRTYDPDSPIVPFASKSNTSNVTHQRLIDDFRKGIKRDKSQYPALREDKQWDNWHRSALVTARSHGCDHIFDPTFKPNTPEEIGIFDEKQKFMYSVFEDKLLTDMGKHLVRKHQNDYDAHAIFQQLAARAQTST